jgi:hypothetical protein
MTFDKRGKSLRIAMPGVAIQPYFLNYGRLQNSSFAGEDISHILLFARAADNMQ